jgi:hypothetical protein
MTSFLHISASKRLSSGRLYPKAYKYIKFCQRCATVELKNTTLSIKIAKNVQNTAQVKNISYFLTTFIFCCLQTPVIWQFCSLHSKGDKPVSLVGVTAVCSILQRVRDTVCQIYCT